MSRLLRPDRSPVVTRPDIRERAGRGASWIPWLAALVGVAWYVTALGAYTLNPTDLGWLAYDDWAAHLVGWLFFRNEPWALPLGTIRNLLHPVGTTVGFTDGNPWVAVLFKPLSHWLPTDFQYVGPWLALSFALQGFVGAKIMACFTSRPLHQLLGATLFVLAPPLLRRVGHNTLTAHWLILGLIWLNVRPVDSIRSMLFWAFAFNAIAAGVHPYLPVMLIPLTMALLVRLYLEAPSFGPGAAVALGVCLILQTIGVFVLLGYLGPSAGPGGAGFGTFSADLLTLFNSMGYSRWLPSLPAGSNQHEGFGFLGTGVMGLALVGVAVHVARSNWPGIPRGQRPLLAAAVLTAVFALSNYVTLGGEVVLTMRSFYEPLTPLAESLRSSGRFIWPFHYVLLTGILALAVRKGGLTSRAASVLLLAAVTVQAAEVRGLGTGTRPARGGWPRMQSPVWETLGPPYRHLVLYPLYYVAAVPTADCPPAVGPYMDVVRLADLAYRKGLTINSAYVSRASGDAMGAHCRELAAEVSEGRFAPDAVYVVTPAESKTPLLRAGSTLTCGTLDGYYVCVSSSSDGAFRRSLAAAAEAGGEAQGQQDDARAFRADRRIQ